MASIIALGKGSLKPLHAIDQITLRRLQQQVVVVAHQAPRMNRYLVAHTHFPEAPDKQIGIFLVLENIATLVPSTHYMVARTGIFNSQSSGHAKKVESKRGGVKTNSNIHRLTPFPTGVST